MMSPGSGAPRTEIVRPLPFCCRGDASAQIALKCSNGWWQALQKWSDLHAVEPNSARSAVSRAPQNGHVTAAARRAGIPRRTFYRMLERYQLQGADFRP